MQDGTAIYDLKYYESGLWEKIEGLLEGEKIFGNVLVKRKYVVSHLNGGVECDKMFVMHT